MTDSIFTHAEAAASRRSDDVLWDYPLPGLRVASSTVQGEGLFVTVPVPQGKPFAQVWVITQHGMMRTKAGRYFNHSEAPNAAFLRTQDGAVLIALKRLAPGDEVLVDYRTIYGQMASAISPGGVAMSGWDDDDLGSVSIDAAVFGPPPTTPSGATQPIVRDNAFADQLNGQYQGFPFKQPPGPLSAQQQAEIQGIVQALANFLYNTQLTAALPAHNTPTNWSLPVDRSGVVTIPAAVDVNWTTICEYDVGPGRWMRITGYGINVREAGYTYNGSLVWRLLVNGVPVPSLEQFAEQRGTLVSPRQIFALAQQDQRVALQVRRAIASPGPNTVEGAFTGYIWRLRNDYDGTRASVSAY
jgi:hypothetical protein